MKNPRILSVEEHTRYVRAEFFGAQASARPQMRPFAIAALLLAIQERALISGIVKRKARASKMSRDGV